MYEYKATVKRIIDGDTIVVDIDLGFNTILKNEKLRFYGINTPEIRTKDLKEKEKGFQAKRRVEELLPLNSIIKIQTFKDTRGKYGRFLGIPFTLIDNNIANNICEILLSEGLANKL